MTELNPLDRIQELCDERNWSYYQLAKVSGIAYSTLSTMINKHNMPSLPTLQKLCSGFGISITDFFDPGNSSKGLTSDQAQCLKLFTALRGVDIKLPLAAVLFFVVQFADQRVHPAGNGLLIREDVYKRQA